MNRTTLILGGVLLVIGGFLMLRRRFDRFPVTSSDGGRPPVSQAFRFRGQNGPDDSGHNGTDFAVPVGTPAVSVGRGRVAQVNLNPLDASGIFVIVEGEGEHADLAWSYSHLSSVAVNVGDELAPGDVVGATGNTGETTGPHLHFVVMLFDGRALGRCVDSEKYLPA